MTSKILGHLLLQFCTASVSCQHISSPVMLHSIFSSFYVTKDTNIFDLVWSTANCTAFVSAIPVTSLWYKK